MDERSLSRELKKGVIELAILAVLRNGRKYGWQIIRELDSLSEGFLKIKEGTLYPALHRMEERGLIKSEWVIEGKKAPRKYYKLTEKGEKAYESGRETWNLLERSMRRLLGEKDE